MISVESKMRLIFIPWKCFYFCINKAKIYDRQRREWRSALAWKLINAAKEKNEWPDDPRHCQDVKLLRWEFHGFFTGPSWSFHWFNTEKWTKGAEDVTQLGVPFNAALSPDLLCRESSQKLSTQSMVNQINSTRPY